MSKKSIVLEKPDWSNARRFLDAAVKFDRCKLASQVLCGFELLELHKLYGIAQGKRTDLYQDVTSEDRRSKFHDETLIQQHPSNKEVNFFRGERSSWADLVKVELGVSEATAWRWMEMARAVGPRLRKYGDIRDIPLLETPLCELTQDQQERLKNAVHKLTDEKTQLEFMRELGLTKAPQGSGLRGGRGGSVGSVGSGESKGKGASESEEGEEADRGLKGEASLEAFLPHKAVSMEQEGANAMAFELCRELHRFFKRDFALAGREALRELDGVMLDCRNKLKGSLVG